MGFGAWLSGCVGAVVDSIAACINFLKWGWRRIEEHLGVVIVGLLAGIAYIWKKLWELVGAGSEMVQQMQDSVGSGDDVVTGVTSGWIGALRFIHYLIDVEVVVWGALACVSFTLGCIVYRVIKSYLPTASSS